MLVAVALPVLFVALTTLAWAVDSAMNSGNVARNVSVVGTELGGLDRDELDARMTDIAAGYADTPVIITTADGRIETTAGVVGLELDPEATADRVMETGRGFLLARPFSWLGGLFGERTAEAAVRLGQGEPETLAALVNAEQPEPVEPTVIIEDGEAVAVPGESAEAFDLDSIRDEVLEAARLGDSPIVVEASPVETLPVRSDDVAQAFADEINAATADGIEAVAGAETDTIEVATLRSWIQITDDGQLAYTLDNAAVMADLVERFPGISGNEGDDPVIVVDDEGNPRIEGRDAKACCADDSTDRVLAALLVGDPSVELGLVDATADQDELLQRLGIVEVIGEATTPHNCCESRVVNIQRFADLIRGTIIAPGETLSLNDAVGRRTIEKGFVESGVIYSGEITTDVGGGISQFATTIFQASFYGGLDIDEYQAHTLEFGRYQDFAGRRGIESTISFPVPDVKLTNNTPYPVLIWPTYTDTSLTVSLYSTKWVEADVANQDIYASGQCTVIDTERIRTYPDGTTETDLFRARYQPADGIGCDGKPTNPNSATPTPVPTAEPDPEPTTEPDPDPDPEPTAEPDPDPEPTATPEPEPEPTATPDPEPTPTPTPDAGGGDDGGDDAGL